MHFRMFSQRGIRVWSKGRIVAEDWKFPVSTREGVLGRRQLPGSCCASFSSVVAALFQVVASETSPPEGFSDKSRACLCFGVF